MDDLAEQEQLSELHAKQLMEKLRVIEEDDEFDLAFRAVLQDSVSSVTTAASKNNLDKMVIPAILPKPKNTFRLQNDEDDRMMTTDRQQGKGTSLSCSSIARMYVCIDRYYGYEWCCDSFNCHVTFLPVLHHHHHHHHPSW